MARDIPLEIWRDIHDVISSLSVDVSSTDI